MSYSNKNTKPCDCCGQERPCPTEPGIWEYNENVTMRYGKWVRVTIVAPPEDEREYDDDLHMYHDGDTKPAWWPQHGAAWRKVS